MSSTHREHNDRRIFSLPDARREGTPGLPSAQADWLPPPSETFAMNSGNITSGASLRPLAHTHTSGLQTASLAVPSRQCHHPRVIIAEGAIPRLHQFGRGLSIAESWVANSVLVESLSGMFYCGGWLQTTPPRQFRCGGQVGGATKHCCAISFYLALFTFTS